MGFPEFKFGLCPFGGNVIENETPTSGADAPVNAAETIGPTMLKWYPRLSRYVCPQCIIRLDDDEKAIKANFRHQKEQEFRSKAGFLNYVPKDPAPATYPPPPYPANDSIQD
jgi:hypothetical protein